MKVRVTKKGFWKGITRHVDETFNYDGAKKDMPSWVDPVEKTVSTAKPQRPAQPPVTGDATENGAPSTPTGDQVPSGDTKTEEGEGTPSASKMSLAEAVEALDHNNDEHWTSGGKPAMAAIETMTGDESITRKNVEELAPDLIRQA